MSLLKLYSQLSEEQKELIHFCTNKNENIFLEGPPWSGKLLICLYSLRNSMERSNISSLCMVSNNAMYGYMHTALKELGIDEQTYIASKDKYFWKMAAEYGVSISMISDYYENYDSILTNLLKEDIEEKYDLIIVNEVQDYFSKEWELIKRIAKKILCYADFKQAVYDNKVERDTILKDCIHKLLHFPEANVAAAKLMRVRDYFFADNTDDTESSAKNSLFFEENDIGTIGPYYKFINVRYEDEYKAIADIIKALEPKNSRVAVICPDNNRFAELSFYLKSHSIDHTYYEINGDLKNHDFTSTSPLFISIFNAEGLQFDNVILFGFDQSNYIIQMKRKENRLNIILYVSMTRARDTTYIVRSEDGVGIKKNVWPLINFDCNQKTVSFQDTTQFFMGQNEENDMKYLTLHHEERDTWKLRK